MLNYNAPLGSKSTIDQGGNANQMNSFYWLRKSLIEARKEQYFMPLAAVENMPKNFGKTMKVYQYVPLLDDRNVNDQGIDAAGITITNAQYYVTYPKLVFNATNAGKVAAVNAINNNINVNGAAETVAVAGANDSGGVGFSTITITTASGTPVVKYATQALANTAIAVAPGSFATKGSGNLYGSSRDAGTIAGKIPFLGENGGRVNRVSFTRVQREGSIHKMGFFTDFTKESLDFDSDSELMSHLSTELMNGAVQLTEAVLQMDLLAAAGVEVYPGTATTVGGVTAEGTTIPNTPDATSTILSYLSLRRLDRNLTDNRTPLQTTIITGSRYIDTKVIPSARIAYIGPDVVPLLADMKDTFGNKAFVGVEHYADAGTVLNGEIGRIGNFRFIQVPEMLKWAGAGKAVTGVGGANNPGYQATNGNYDVFPVLVVGDKSFTTIGYQTDGKSVKFDVTTKMPGKETADRGFDPYGETGFSSIKWYYGILVMRPERIGLIRTTAPI